MRLVRAVKALRQRRASRRANPEGQMTIWEHLGELRTRIMRCLVAIAIGGTAGFLLYPWIMDRLLDPYCQALDARDIARQCSLIITDPLEGFTTRLKVSGYTGLVLALPVVLWQVWRFVTPGLYARERRLAVPFVASSMVLFLLGAGIAYWTFPKALDFLIGISGDNVEPFFAPAKYIGLVTVMMVVFGLGFEFPILLIFLQLAGVVSPQRLAASRRFAIVGIVALVAVGTPSGDPYSLFALSVPMVVFYEVAILVGKAMLRRRAARAAAAAPAT